MKLGLLLSVAVEAFAVTASARTISGEIVKASSESDLGGDSEIVLTNNGGVEFTQSLTVGKTYRIEGTGSIAVAAGKTVKGSSACLAAGSLGQTLVKKGPGILEFTDAVGVVSDQTRWIVEEGALYHDGWDLFGGAVAATTNMVIDIREKAEYRITGNSHCPVGPIELTGGTFSAPNATTSEKWRNTTLRGGVKVHASARASKLDFASGAHLNHIYTDVVFDIDDGAVLDVFGTLGNGVDSKLNFIDNKLVKTGKGELHFRSPPAYTGGTVASGGAIVAYTNCPLGEITLKGTRLAASGMFSDVAPGAAGGASGLECFADATPFDLSQGLHAQASDDGTPSTVDAYAVSMAGGDAETRIDVDAGASLVLDALMQPKGGEGGILVKSGSGELKLNRSCGAKDLRFEAGKMTLATDARFSCDTQIVSAPGTRFELEDGAVLPCGAMTPGAVLSKADVWLDASSLGCSDGMSVERVPNLGRAGGAFEKFSWTTVGYVIPDAPRFVANGIDGKGALSFNGGQALQLQSYTNTTPNARIFFVGEWTSWEATGGKGKWTGPLSFANRGLTGDDNACNGAITYMHAGATVDALTTYSRAQADLSSSSIEVGHPYFMQTDRLGQTVTTTVFSSDATGEVSATKSAAVLSPLEVSLVSVGGRLAKDGASQTVSTETNEQGIATGGTFNRMYIGRIGELLVFSDDLTDDEVAAVAAYLKRKWLGSKTAIPAAAAGGSAGPLEVTVSAGASATVAGICSSVLPAGQAVLSKTGAGELVFAASSSGDGAVKIDEGSLTLSGRSIASRADVWMDAGDASTVDRDEGGAVSAVANKGRCGGSFVPASGAVAATMTRPIVLAEGLSGLPAVSFDGNSALVLNTYTNKCDKRNLHVYMAMRRTSYEAVGGKGKWGGPFSFNSVSFVGDDQGSAGSYHLEESATNQTAHFIGQYNIVLDKPFNTTDEVHLFVCHQYEEGAKVALERVGDDTDAVPVWVQSRIQPIDVDFVMVGGRSTTGGKAQWYGTDNQSNRMWSGLVGELIVFTEPLGLGDERALLAYLRAKWLAKGSGTSVPPTFLSGNVGTPDFGSCSLEMSADTALSSSAPTLALSGLTAAANVTWRRDWSGAPSGYPFFAVSGEMSFTAPQTLTSDAFPGESAMLFGGNLSGSLPIWHVTGPKAKKYHVESDSDGVWLKYAPPGLAVFVR